MCTHTTHTQLILTEKSQNWLKNEQKIWNSNHFFKTTARQDAHVHSPNKHTQRTEVRGHSSRNSRAAWATYWCLILKSKYLLKTFFLKSVIFSASTHTQGGLADCATKSTERSPVSTQNEAPSDPGPHLARNPEHPWNPVQEGTVLAYLCTSLLTDNIFPQRRFWKLSDCVKYRAQPSSHTAAATS